MKKLSLILIAIFTSLTLVGLFGQRANAACTELDTSTCTPADDVCAGIGSTAASGSGCAEPTGSGSVQNAIKVAVNVLSWVVGITAVIVVIFGGFRYVTSGGDSTKVGSAKNTILYAVIGLIVVAMAQVIVRFTLNKTTGNTPAATATPTQQTYTCNDGTVVNKVGSIPKRDLCGE